MFRRKRPQAEIFEDFWWWDKGCFLYQMTGDRCDYIESCITRVFGEGALGQQEILEIGSGGGLICETLARRKAVTVGIDPSAGAADSLSGTADRVSPPSPWARPERITGA